MGTCDRNIRLWIHRIIRSKILQSLQDAIADSSVSGLRIQDQVNESIIRIVRISNDESSRVDSLAQSSSNLGQACIALSKRSAQHLDRNELILPWS
jgi:hypothetical protein